MLTRIIIALGSNLGDPAENLDMAINELLSLLGTALNCSSYWSSAPQDMDATAATFVNAVLVGETTLSAAALLSTLQSIELKMGRVRSVEPSAALNKEPSAGKEPSAASNKPSTRKNVHESRIIDLDIICFGDALINEPNLIVPHPRAKQRLFVLMPLAELLPEFVLPGQRLGVLALIKLAPKMEITRLARSFPLP